MHESLVDPEDYARVWGVERGETVSLLTLLMVLNALAIVWRVVAELRVARRQTLRDFCVRFGV